MASIHKLPSGSWRVQIRLAGQRPIGKTFKKRADALAWSRRMEGDGDAIEVFPDADARRRTLGQAIDAYMLDYRGKDGSIVRRLSWWKERRGALPLVELTQVKIKDSLRQLGREPAARHAGKKGTVSLGRKKSAATINRYRQALSSVLSWTVQEGWIHKNPALGIKKLPEPHGRVRWLSDSERQALLKACDNSSYSELGLIVRLALSTGARLGEILALRWKDIDLTKRVAFVHQSKNSEPRVLPLIDPVADRIKEKTRPIRGGLLFPSVRDSEKPYPIRKVWDDAVSEAKLEDFRFHDLRHSAASYLAMNGATLLEIGDILGHKTLAMVKRYSHLATEHKQRLLEEVFGKLVK